MNYFSIQICRGRSKRRRGRPDEDSVGPSYLDVDAGKNLKERTSKINSKTYCHFKDSKLRFKVLFKYFELL
jgi:hypothetical protein